MLRSEQNPSLLALGVLVLLLATGAHAQSVAAQDTERKDTASQSLQAPDLNEVMTLLRQQQQELAEQRRMLETQAQKIATLTRELDTLRKPPVHLPWSRSSIPTHRYLLPLRHPRQRRRWRTMELQPSQT